MEFSWVWMRSAVTFMERRTWDNPGLASSATSSSERMQRLISLFRGVRGSRPANRGSRESKSSWDSPVSLPSSSAS